MFYLGTDYIVSSLIWLTLISVFVFTFRKQILAKLYPHTTFDLFISKLRIFLEKTYPNVKFDLSIIEHSKSEPNPDTRKYMIVDSILTQYHSLQIDTTKVKDIHKHWDGYVFNCEPDRDKLPKDWPKRKNVLYAREKKRCFRCSKTIDMTNMSVYMIRSVENGGKYYLENMIATCKDCEKILTNDTKNLSTLEIKDKLQKIVEESF